MLLNRKSSQWINAVDVGLRQPRNIIRIPRYRGRVIMHPQAPIKLTKTLMNVNCRLSRQPVTHISTCFGESGSQSHNSISSVPIRLIDLLDLSWKWVFLAEFPTSVACPLLALPKPLAQSESADQYKPSYWRDPMWGLATNARFSSWRSGHSITASPVTKHQRSSPSLPGSWKSSRKERPNYVHIGR